MTPANEKPLSMVQQAEADPVEALELAAATGAVEGSALLLRVFNQTGITQKELATRVGVSEGRVSQVLSGQENLRISTLARYLHAMGYRLHLSASHHTSEHVIDTKRRIAARTIVRLS
ncbi:MAG: helix-turn-helix domain-containing protein [Propionibacteriaceae bacterium]|nr:helix-turn-helix domain-containing protein [Propionibacteriaceae bacterium]